MTSATRADFLPAPPPAPFRGYLAYSCRSGAEAYNNWLPDLLHTVAPVLPRLQLTICYRSAAQPGLAGSGIRPIVNFLQLSLAEPLPAALLVQRPEIWLFTGTRGKWRHPTTTDCFSTEWDASALAAPGACLIVRPAARQRPAQLRFALVTTAPLLAGPLSAEVKRCANVFREALTLHQPVHGPSTSSSTTA